MIRSRLTSQRLVAIFLFGCALFNYPLLFLFDRGITVFGVPLLFIYIFLVWGGLIVMMAWTIERRGER